MFLSLFGVDGARTHSYQKKYNKNCLNWMVNEKGTEKKGKLDVQCGRRLCVHFSRTFIWWTCYIIEWDKKQHFAWEQCVIWSHWTRCIVCIWLLFRCRSFFSPNVSAVACFVVWIHIVFAKQTITLSFKCTAKTITKPLSHPRSELILNGTLLVRRNTHRTVSWKWNETIHVKVSKKMFC